MNKAENRPVQSASEGPGPIAQATVPLVSVVIPLHQKAAHIARALDSVLRQSFRDFEVVVVDDGSTDDGGDVVRGCPDTRVRLVTQENRGAAAARNRGVAEASSSLVAFLDADDEWDPDFLELLVGLHVRFPEAAAFGVAYRLVRANGDIRLPRFHGGLPEPAGSGLISYFAGAGGNSPLHSSSVLVRKAALLRAGGFPEDVVYGEDHDTWLRLALRFPIAWTWNPAVSVHVDAENRSYGPLYHGNFPFFESCQAFLREQGGDARLPANVTNYLVRRHTSLLFGNWLAGDRAAIQEIARDCLRLPGARGRCVAWLLLSWTPRSVVRALWGLWRALSGRRPVVPALRSMRRVTSEVKAGTMARQARLAQS